MKKLVLLLMVLGLATGAYALTGVELSIRGVTNGAGVVQEEDIDICEEVVIDVHGSTEGYGVIIIIADASFDSADPLGHGGEWGDDMGPPSYEMCSGYYYENTAYPVVEAAAGDLGNVIRWELNGYGFGYQATAGATIGDLTPGKHFEFIYHCCGPESEYVTIDLYDKLDPSAPIDSIVIHQIPEPATLMLLGLGGLFLRRRK